MAFSEDVLTTLRKTVSNRTDGLSTVRWDGLEANGWRTLRFQAVTSGLQLLNAIDFDIDVGRVKTQISQVTDKAINELVEQTFAKFAEARGEVDGVIDAAEQTARTKIATAKQTRDAAIQIAGAESPANKVYGEYLSQLPKHLQLTRGLVMQKVALERQRSGSALARISVDAPAGTILDEPPPKKEGEAAVERQPRPGIPDAATLYGQLSKVHELNALYMTGAPQLLYGATAPKPSPARVAAANTLLTAQQQAEASPNAELPEARDPLSLNFGLENKQPSFALDRFKGVVEGQEEQSLKGRSPASQVSIKLTPAEQQQIKTWLDKQKELVRQLNLSILELRRRSGYVFKEGEARESEQPLFNALKAERAEEAGEYAKGVLFAAALGEWAGNMPKSAANLAAVQQLTGKTVSEWLRSLKQQTADAENRTRSLENNVNPNAARTSFEGYVKTSLAAPSGLAVTPEQRRKLEQERRGTPAQEPENERPADPLKIGALDQGTPAAMAMIGTGPAAGAASKGLGSMLQKVIGPNGLHVGIYGPLAAWNLASIAKTQFDSEFLKSAWESESSAYTSALKAAVGPETADVAAQWAKRQAKVEANALEQYAEFVSNFYKNQTELVKVGNKQNFQNAMTHLIGRVKRDPAHDDKWAGRATSERTAYSREANAVIAETNRIMEQYYNSLSGIFTDQVRGVPMNPIMPVVPGTGGLGSPMQTIPQPAARPRVDLVKPPENMK